MQISPFYVVKNDLQPVFPAQVKDSAGNAVNLTGATIYCTMKTKGGSAVKINRQTTGISITDAVNGKFEYQWQAGDTDTACSKDTKGEYIPYLIEFEVNPASGGKYTVPNPTQGEAQVIVADSLDAV